MTKTQLINFGNELATLNYRQPLTMVQIRKLLMYGTYTFADYESTASEKPNTDGLRFSFTIDIPATDDPVWSRFKNITRWVVCYNQGILTIKNDNYPYRNNTYPNGAKELNQIRDWIHAAVANQAQHAADTTLSNIDSILPGETQADYEISFGYSNANTTRETFMTILSNNWDQLMVKNFPPVDPKIFNEYTPKIPLPQLIQELETIAAALSTTRVDPTQATKNPWVQKFLQIQQEIKQPLYGEMVTATNYKYDHIKTGERILKYYGDNTTNVERVQAYPNGLFLVNQYEYALPVMVNTQNPVSNTIPTLIQNIRVAINGLKKIYQETLPRK